MTEGGAARRTRLRGAARGRLAVPILLATGSLAVVTGGRPSHAPPPLEQESLRSPPPGFVGSSACADCHADRYAEWAASTHGRAGGTPGQVEVIAPFDGAPIVFADATVIPSIGSEGEYRFAVQREDLDDVVLTVHGVVGGGHMQGGGTQGFVSRFEDGTVRFLPFDYSRAEDLWFCNTSPIESFWMASVSPGLRPDMGWVPITPTMKLTDCGDWPPVRVLGTSTRFANCQQCHGSQITMAYDTLARGYETGAESLAINCESCHGPAAEHVRLAREGSLADRSDVGLRSLDDLDEDASLGVCFQCHALKRALRSDYLPGDTLANYYSLGAPLIADEPLFPDGRVRTFAYQANHRFSDCYLNGRMTCVDCHEPHGQGYRDVFRRPLSGPLDDGQCTGCHVSKAADPVAHTHHPPDSDGARCVSCHMPYLQQPVLGGAIRYARSDHTIAVPRPGLDDAMGVPNACGSCHQDLNPNELALQARVWWGRIKPRKAIVEGLAAIMDRPLLADEATRLLGLAADHPMAALMVLNRVLEDLLEPGSPRRYPDLQAALTRLTEHSDLDVRATATAALHLAWSDDLEVRALLDGLARTADPDAAAFRARWSLVLILVADRYGKRGDAVASLASFEKALEVRPDDPDVVLNVAVANAALGRHREAIPYFVRSLELDGTQAVGFVNLGVSLEALGREEDARAAYETAIHVRPQEALANMNLGNIYLRGGDVAAAIGAYEAAVAADPSLARAGYYLAVAYLRSDRTEDAYRALLRARAFAPRDSGIQELLDRVSESRR